MSNGDGNAGGAGWRAQLDSAPQDGYAEVGKQLQRHFHDLILQAIKTDIPSEVQLRCAIASVVLRCAMVGVLVCRVLRLLLQELVQLQDKHLRATRNFEEGQDSHSTRLNDSLQRAGRALRDFLLETYNGAGDGSITTAAVRYYGFDVDQKNKYRGVQGAIRAVMEATLSRRVCYALDANGQPVYRCESCKRSFLEEDHLASPHWEKGAKRHRNDASRWRDPSSYPTLHEKIKTTKFTPARLNNCQCLSFQDLNHEVFSQRCQEGTPFKGWGVLHDWRNGENDRIRDKCVPLFITHCVYKVILQFWACLYW